jgi:hypothetical protein
MIQNPIWVGSASFRTLDVSDDGLNFNSENIQQFFASFYFMDEKRAEHKRIAYNI